MTSQSHDGLHVHGIIEQDELVAVSSLNGVFAIIQVLIQSDNTQISMMGPLCKQLGDARILASRRHEIV